MTEIFKYVFLLASLFLLYFSLALGQVYARSAGGKLASDVIQLLTKLKFFVFVFTIFYALIYI